MDEKEFKRFNRELNSDPTKGPISHGTRELMGLFGGPTKPPSRPSTKKKPKEPVNPDRKAPRPRGR